MQNEADVALTWMSWHFKFQSKSPGCCKHCTRLAHLIRSFASKLFAIPLSSFFQVANMVKSPLRVCLQLAVVGAVLAPTSVTGFGFGTSAAAGGVGGYQPGTANGGFRQMIMNMLMQKYGGGGYGYGGQTGGYGGGYGAGYGAGGYGAGGYGAGGYDQYNSGGYYRRRAEETPSNEGSGPDDASPIDSNADGIPDAQADLTHNTNDRSDLGTPLAIDNDAITAHDQVNTNLLSDVESSSHDGSSQSESDTNRSTDPEQSQDNQVGRRLRKV